MQFFTLPLILVLIPPHSITYIATHICLCLDRYLLRRVQIFVGWRPILRRGRPFCMQWPRPDWWRHLGHLSLCLGWWRLNLLCCFLRAFVVNGKLLLAFHQFHFQDHYLPFKWGFQCFTGSYIVVLWLLWLEIFVFFLQPVNFEFKLIVHSCTVFYITLGFLDLSL